MKSVLLIILFFFAILPVFSQSNAEKYFEALEKFDLRTAYSYVHESEQQAKPIAEFEKDHPLEILKGFRNINDNFFRFEVLKPNKLDQGAQYPIKTVSATGNNGAWFRNIEKSIKREATKQEATYSPEFVSDFMNKNPRAIERFFKEDTLMVVEIDGKLMLGWIEEAEKLKMDKIAAEARAYAGMGSKHGGYKFKEAIEGLKSYKDKIPDHELITKRLPLYEKKYSILQKVKISINLAKVKGTPYASSMLYHLIADLENNSDATLTWFTLWYEFKDENGNILYGNKDPNNIKIDPVPPGYKGEFKVRSLKDEDVEAIKKSSTWTIEIKDLKFEE